MDINSSISLLSHIHSITADYLIEQLKQKGLPDFASSHGNILFQLSKNERMTMKDLAQKINRDKSTTTVLVRKLEQENLVKSEPDANDKRSKIICLTDNGKQYTRQMGEISTDLLSTFYKDFSENEKSQFLSFLERIQSNFS